MSVALKFTFDVPSNCTFEAEISPPEMENVLAFDNLIAVLAVPTNTP